MDFREIVAEYEAELVHAACRAEGLDAALTGRIMAWHRANSSRLDFAERSEDGVGHYVRSLAGALSWSARPSGARQAGGRVNDPGATGQDRPIPPGRGRQSDGT